MYLLQGALAGSSACLVGSRDIASILDAMPRHQNMQPRLVPPSANLEPFAADISVVLGKVPAGCIAHFWILVHQSSLLMRS